VPSALLCTDLKQKMTHKSTAHGCAICLREKVDRSQRNNSHNAWFCYKKLAQRNNLVLLFYCKMPSKHNPSEVKMYIQRLPVSALVNRPSSGHILNYIVLATKQYVVKYKVVQIWPGQTVTCLHIISPGHIWTTLYMIVFNETVKRDKILPLDYLNLYACDLMMACW
jgi:hypothetical protein